ncbi:PAS domain S-box protein, partial [bacterium]|nr:PAS domain S-box protein [bacterium]
MFIIVSLVAVILGERIAKAEETLQYEQNLFKALLDNIPDAIYFKDKESRLVRISGSYSRWFNMRSEEIIGKTDADLFEKNLGEGWLKEENEIMKSGKPMINKEEMEETVDGKERWVSTTKLPWFDESNNIIGTFGISRDIAKQKEAEEVIRESEERLKAILYSMNIGVVLIESEEHKIVDVNPYAERMIGAPKEKIIGTVCHNYICPADVGKCPITDLGEEVNNKETVLISDIGKRVPVLKTALSITLSGKQYLLDSFVDITEQKKVEEKLKYSEKHLSNALRIAKLGHWEYDAVKDQFTFTDE